ncbi:hypothetical protein R1flu_021245 [Riccia fluitans]|uniref:F-box domain-containing protein n=1 Tax=Riccia fluitans TaxID=41844 RepID=A0ABD1ZNT7_9MARC
MQTPVQGGCGERRLSNVRKKRKVGTQGASASRNALKAMASVAAENSSRMCWDGGRDLDLKLGSGSSEERNLEGCDRSPASTSQRDSMSPSIWSTLPDHLLDNILVRLPLQSFFRFRQVCRNWNTHMSTRSFLEAYAERPSQGPWFFFFTHDERNHVSTYDSSLNKWHRIPLSPPHSNTNPFSAADGGLVCYFSYENGSKSVVVCNPLTKSRCRLPPLLKVPSKITMLAMVVDRVTRAYKVLVAGVSKYEHVPLSRTAEVYDSQTQCWTTTENIPATHWLTGKPVFCNGMLYVRSYAQRNILLSCDLDQCAWSDLQIPLPSTVRHGELLHWQGRIMMVGELEEDQKIQSICIWELQSGSLKWKEIDRLPAGLFESVFGDKDYFQSNEQDDVILDWCQAGRLVLLFTYNLYDVRGRCKLLVYDLSNKSWEKLQSFSRTDVCGTGRIIRGIFYEPRLDAVA